MQVHRCFGMTRVGEWKKQAMTGVFSGKKAAQDVARSSEAEMEKPHAKIGQLVVEHGCAGLRQLR